MINSPDAQRDVIALIRKHIDVHRNQIYTQIRHYPAPIPACDVQYNHLLEQRAGITQELSRLNALSRGPQSILGLIDSLCEFIDDSSSIHGEVRQELHAALIKSSRCVG